MLQDATLAYLPSESLVQALLWLAVLGGYSPDTHAAVRNDHLCIELWIHQVTLVQVGQSNSTDGQPPKPPVIYILEIF